MMTLDTLDGSTVNQEQPNIFNGTEVVYVDNLLPKEPLPRVVTNDTQVTVTSDQVTLTNSPTYRTKLDTLAKAASQRLPMDDKQHPTVWVNGSVFPAPNAMPIPLDANGQLASEGNLANLTSR